VDHLLVSFLLAEPSPTRITAVSLVDIGGGSMQPPHLDIVRSAPGTQPTSTKQLPVDMTTHVGLELVEDLLKKQNVPLVVVYHGPNGLGISL
jgi:hypothetical protein